MNMTDWILVGVLVLILGLVIFYVARAKRNGKKCIGCPDAQRCNGLCGGCKGEKF